MTGFQKINNILNPIIPFFIYYNLIQIYILYLPAYRMREEGEVFSYIPIIYATIGLFLLYFLYIYLKIKDRGQKAVNYLFMPFKLFFIVYAVIYMFNSLYYTFGKNNDFEVKIPNEKEYSLYQEYQKENIKFADELDRIEHSKGIKLSELYDKSRKTDTDMLKRLVKIADEYSAGLGKITGGEAFFNDYRSEEITKGASFFNYVKIRVIESRYRKNMDKEIKMLLNEMTALTGMEEISLIEGIILNQSIFEVLENTDKKVLLKNKEVLEKLNENHKVLYEKSYRFDSRNLQELFLKDYEHKWFFGIPYLNIESTKYIANKNTQKRIDNYYVRGTSGNTYKVTTMDYLVNPLGALVMNISISTTSEMEKKFWKVEDMLEELVNKN